MLLFCTPIDSVPLSEMVQDALATSVMAHPDLHHCFTALLKLVHFVLNNRHSDFSLPLRHMKIVESVEAMLKMLMHTLCHPRLPLSYPLTTPMPTGMNTVSRTSQTALWSSQSFTLFKVIPNLANSGKSTLLLSCDRLSLASRTPHMTGPCTRPLLRVLTCSCFAKLTTLLWRALMKTSPSIHMLRLAEPCNSHLKMHPHSSASATSKTSTDLMLRSILTPSSSLVRSTTTVS